MHQCRHRYRDLRGYQLQGLKKGTCVAVTVVQIVALRR